MNSFIPVNEPLLKGNEKKYLNECINSGWISSEGPFVKRFEDLFANKVERKHGIAVCNGSAALETAVTALGIHEGDEVILPTFTIISCAAAVIRAGAKPVLVDVDPNTYNMDTKSIETKISSRTKAIMAVHTYGLPVDMDPILQLGEKYSIKIIEDAAETLGQTYYGKPCGSFGDASTFSFYPNKHITTGEGGMVVTDIDQLSEKCRSLRNLCFKKEKRFEHDELGYNFRMTNLQAALGLAQLEQLDSFIVKKRLMGQKYTDRLKQVQWLQLPIAETGYAENIYWVYPLVLGDAVPFNAQEAMRKLSEQGIGTRPFFWPLHKQPVFNKMGLFTGESYPVSEKIALRGFYIPSGLALTDDEIFRVSESTINLMN